MNTLYLIIDEQYRIYQTPVLTGKVRSLGREGKVSIVNIKTMQGMNRPEMEEELGGDWVDIQQLPEKFE